MFIELVKSAALILALSMLYSLGGRWWRGSPHLRQIAIGLLFGGVAVVGIRLALELQAGVIFDPRSVVLSMAGLFGGPVAGLLAILIAGAYRISLGGAGMPVGVATIVAAVAWGLVFRWGHRRGWIRLGLAQLLGFGVVVHLTLLALFTRLPAEALGPVLSTIAVPMLLAFVPATALLGLLLRDADARLETEQSLKETRDRQRQTLSELRIMATAFKSQDGIFVTDRGLTILEVNPAFSAISGVDETMLRGRRLPDLQLISTHLDHGAVEIRDAFEQGIWQGERILCRQDHARLPVWLSVQAVVDESEKPTHLVFRFKDISERKSMEESIRHLVFFDPLTRLPNRRLMLDRLEEAQARSAQAGGHGALLFIDLDNFRSLNETRGHRVGDRYLELVARRLSAVVEEGDTVGRLGGDEFLVLLETLGQDLHAATGQVEARAGALIAALGRPFDLAGREFVGTASVGAALFKGQELGGGDLLKRSELAMYEAKKAGRNRLSFFDPGMQVLVDERARLEREIRQALRENEFRLHYQVQVDDSGKVIGAEALLRWQHPDRGLLAPDAFLATAEHSTLIEPIGVWVLETACRQLAEWRTHPVRCGWRLAVNVSARELHSQDFPALLEDILWRTGAPPERLWLEITESVLLEDIERISIQMGRLKKRGVSFSLDDFGTGYSSLSYLKRLPLDQLKIDKSFVLDLESDANDAAIAKTIIDLGRSLGIDVIAEGVETLEQQEILSGFGCKSFQGFRFGRPVPANQLPDTPDCRW